VPVRRAADVTQAEYPDLSVAIATARRPELDAESLGLSVLLSRLAYTHVTSSEARVHDRYGWTWLGFRLLFMTWLFEPVQARDLERLTGVSRQTISSLVSTMESRGILTRQRTSSADRRLIEIRLTPEGRTQVESAMVEQNRGMREWLSVLSAAERDVLRGLVVKLVAGAPSA
jgi:DNA-binding MarR family transcriptional regulator